jgi:hypothetical protein
LQRHAFAARHVCVTGRQCSSMFTSARRARVMAVSLVPIIHGCWADLFELSRFRGPRRRLYGPGQWSAFRSPRPDWGWQVDSLIVGPDAHAQVYRADQFETTVQWFLPGEKIEDLLQIVGDEADSLRLLDRAPDPADPAHPAYERAKSRRRA